MTVTGMTTRTSTSTATPSVSDDPSASLRTSFNRSNSSNLGSNWTERAGDLQIYSNTLRNAGTSYDDNLATWNGGSYGNVFVSAKAQFSSLNGSLTVAGRLGSYSGGIPAAGYAAELLSNGQVKLWRLSDWAQLGSTYTISGFQSGQTVTLGLRLSGSSLSVEIDGVTRISATDSTFSTGVVGLWSYQPTSANQHIFDDFLVQNLGQGYIPRSMVRAVENALVKIAHRGNELRKAQILQTPPAGHAWTSYYFAGSARIAMRVQVSGSGDQVYYLRADHLGSTTVSYRSDGGETRYQQYYPWGELRPGSGTSLPTDRTYTSRGGRRSGYTFSTLAGSTSRLDVLRRQIPLFQVGCRGWIGMHMP